MAKRFHHIDFVSLVMAREVWHPRPWEFCFDVIIYYLIRPFRLELIVDDQNGTAEEGRRWATRARIDFSLCANFCFTRRTMFWSICEYIFACVAIFGLCGRWPTQRETNKQWLAGVWWISVAVSLSLFHSWKLGRRNAQAVADFSLFLHNSSSSTKKFRNIHSCARGMSGMDFWYRSFALAYTVFCNLKHFLFIKWSVGSVVTYTEMLRCLCHTMSSETNWVRVRGGQRIK